MVVLPAHAPRVPVLVLPGRLFRQVIRFAVLLATLCPGVSCPAAGEPLVVGVREVPPFVIRQADGSYTGLSIELWQAVADELGLDYQYRPTNLAGLLDGLKTGELDIAVAALTVTANRERDLDFSHPFHSSGLAIAVPSSPTGALATLRAALSREFLQALAVLALLLFAVGVLIWLLERRANPGQFGGGLRRGIGSGFWWSAVTMTTVGYGDKAPVTAAGRLVAILWMFFSVITISGFTAAIASVFTVQQLSGPVNGPGDLDRVVVGSVRGSTSDAYLQGHGVRVRYYQDVEAALASLPGGRAVEAVVYDAPIMRYLVNADPELAVQVLPGSFLRQDYAFGLPDGSELREAVNRAMLRVIASPAWEAMLARYLGR